MSTKYKIIASIMLLILANSILFMYLAISHYNRQFDEFIDSQANATRAIISTIEQHSYQGYKSRIQAFIQRFRVEGNGATLHAFQQRQREKLSDLTVPFFDILHTQNRYLSGLAFVLPDNTNFLRVHNLEKFGDDVSKKRPDIVDANLNQHQNTGYTIAGINLVYTIVQPISFHGEHLGVLQIAIKGNQLLDSIKKELNIPVSVLMSAEKSKFVEQTTMKSISSGSSSIYAFEIDFFRDATPQIDWSLEQQKVTVNGKTFVILKAFDLNNFKGQLQGQIVVGIDISQKISDLNSNIMFVVFICLIFLILSFVISDKGYNTLSRLLRQRTAELQDNIQRYKLAASNTSDLIYELDLQSREIKWFGDIEKMLGYSIANEDEWLAAFHPEDRERIRQEYQKILDGSLDPLMMQYKIKHHDGTWKIWSENGDFITDKTGKPSLWIGACSDITGQISSEKERLRLVTAIDQASETVVITDIKGTIQYVNPAFEELTGYSRDEAIGQNPSILQSGKHDQTFYKEMWKILLQGDVWSGHIINKKKNGSLFEEEVTISPIKSNKGKIVNFVAVKRDVSKEVLLEKQLRQAIKMEAIGTLAGGIAHDFNNILSVILGYSGIAKAQLPADDPIRNDLDQVIIAGKRATELVKQILTFSRQGEEDFKPLKIHLILKEVLKLLRASLPTTIQLKESIVTNCGSILADPTQIHQVLMNLCTNAKHAIGEEVGTLSISLSEIQVTEKKAIGDCPQIIPGTYLDLEISDTGCGMNELTRSKIFDPFFTTKEKGKGTGLGLAVVHGIIKQHKAEMTVASEPGQGTIFHIYFPVTDEGVLNEHVIDEDIPQGNGERILFVDDEPTITLVMQKTLESLGYTVTIFTSSVEALSVYQKNPSDFDLVITDMTMPEMTGIELTRKLLTHRPDLPVILCTGFSEAIDETTAKSFGISEYIKKPVDTLTIAKAIRSVIRR